MNEKRNNNKKIEMKRINTAIYGEYHEYLKKMKKEYFENTGCELSIKALINIFISMAKYEFEKLNYHERFELMESIIQDEFITNKGMSFKLL